MAATATFRSLSRKVQPLILSSSKLGISQVRNVTCNESGAILPRPYQVRLGLIKVSIMVVTVKVGNGKATDSTQHSTQQQTQSSQ